MEQIQRMCILSVVLGFLAWSQHAYAQPPRTMSYQGILKDADGDVVADGDYILRFALYESPSGGSAIWEETQVATIRDGIFNVILGSEDALTPLFDRPYWLGVKVGASRDELTPRVELTSSAYSMNARYSTYSLPFLSVNGQPSAGIYFAQQNGNSDFAIAVSTSLKCNLVVLASSRSIPFGGWVAAKLLRNGGTVSEQLWQEDNGSTIAMLVNMYAGTLAPEDGTVTFTVVDPSGSSDLGRIDWTKVVLYAAPIE